MRVLLWQVVMAYLAVGAFSVIVARATRRLSDYGARELGPVLLLLWPLAWSILALHWITDRLVDAAQAYMDWRSR